MKKIEIYIATAKKIRRKGYIKYCLWIDVDGALYVQILDNIIETKRKGTNSSLLFRVSDYLTGIHTNNAYPEMSGKDCITFIKKTSNDNDDSAFVKAILRHLLPK